MITNRRSQEKFNSKNGINRPPLYDLSVYCGGLSWEILNMLKTYVYRVYPNKEQEILLAKHFGCTRFIYNWKIAKKVRKDEIFKHILF